MHTEIKHQFCSLFVVVVERKTSALKQKRGELDARTHEMLELKVLNACMLHFVCLSRYIARLRNDSALKIWALEQAEMVIFQLQMSIKQTLNEEVRYSELLL